MKRSENYKNLLEVIKLRKPLIMDLGDGVLLHLKWDEELKLYRDEMGVTTMNLIQDILNERVYIQKHLVKIREDKENEI